MHTIHHFSTAPTTGSSIGTKAAGLVFLKRNGFTVPAFYLLDYALLKAVSDDRKLLKNFLETWRKQHGIPADSLWAVRSSATVEDGNKHSFAGLFSSEIHVRPNALETAILTVLDRFQETAQLQYHTGESFEYGIILQEMVRSEYAGVAFSHNPMDIAQAEVHITIVPGIGENLVSGKSEAFAIVERNRTLHYESPETTYHGDYFSETLIPVSATGTTIKETLKALIPELISGTKRLAALKKHPVDIEFAIANGTLYWLQVRPITSQPKTVPVIWDNTTAESNYPGITLPLSLSFVRRSFSEAYTSMGLFLGMSQQLISSNRKYLDHMCGNIHGGLYYNVTNWQQLIFQLPFGTKASRQLPKMWGMETAAFIPEKQQIGWYIRVKMLLRLVGAFLFLPRLKRNYIKYYSAVETEFNTIDISRLNANELLETYKRIEQKLGSNWSAPMINGFFTLIVFQALKKAVAASPLAETHPNFVNDILFNQGDVISVAIVREFQRLVKTIQKDAALSNLFTEKTPVEILKELALHFTAFHEQLQTYLNAYGDRSDESELKMEQLSFKDDPDRFITYLKENAAVTFTTDKLSTPASYKTILRKTYPTNLLKRWFLTFLIRQTISKIRDRENFRFMRTKTFAMIRRVFYQLDDKLVQQQLLEQPGDLLYLELEEIEDPTQQQQLKDIVARRKQEYAAYLSMERATRYEQTSQGFEPVSSGNSELKGTEISGTGCCSGIVTAEITCIDENSDPKGNYSGKILVSNYFEPGKIALFSQAAGIISVRGNLLSHTAILCREMGIPSIVGAKGLLSKVRNGDSVTMNGATGKIKLIDHAD